MLTGTKPPVPVSARRCRASTAPRAPCMAASWSATNAPTNTGGPPGSPLSHGTPLMAWMMPS